MCNEGRKKIKKKTAQRLRCNRLKQGLSEWPSFSELDTFDQIAKNNTVAGIHGPPPPSNSSTPNILSDGDEDDNEPTIIGHSIRADRERMSTICKKQRN